MFEKVDPEDELVTRRAMARPTICTCFGASLKRVASDNSVRSRARSWWADVCRRRRGHDVAAAKESALSDFTTANDAHWAWMASGTICSDIALRNLGDKLVRR